MRLKDFISLACPAIFVAIVITFFERDAEALVQIPYENEETSEGWAWARVRRGEDADFNVRCNTTRLESQKYDARWTASCRQISGAFVASLLTNVSLRNLVPAAGVKIVGARIEGELSLQNLKIDRAIVIQATRIEGDVNLTAAKAESLVSFVESRIRGVFNAGQFRSELSLDLSRTEFEKDVLLNDGKIDGYVSTEGAVFDKNLDAGSLVVGGNFFMQFGTHYNEVFLTSTKVTGSVYMDGATFDGPVNADSLVVGASLSMRSIADHKATFKGIILRNARVAGNVQMDGASLAEDLIGDALHVGVSLFMRSTSQYPAQFKAVNLDSARISVNVDMDRATFDGEVSASLLQVGGSLVMRAARYNAGLILIGARIGDNLEMGNSSFKLVRLTGANVNRNVIMEGATFDDDLEARALHVGASFFMGLTSEHNASFNKVDIGGARIVGDINLNGATFYGNLNANFAHIGGNFDMRGATLAELDLSGSSIIGDFRLSGTSGSNPNTFWRIKENKPGRLKLRNTRVTNLMDTKDAWPIHGYLDLEGFRFTHLGGFESGPESGKGGTDSEMRSRGMEWWDKWAQLDPEYSPSPYDQLAAALVASGDREAADEIHFLGRVQQRKKENWPSWLFSGFLQYTAGFGIGDRTFRVLYWVIAISAGTAIYLWKCVPAARKRGAMWCFGASFNRLLPVIELNKEFTDFFNDPKRTRLTDLQVFVFSTIGVVGWVLGAILVAAVSGLTQKP
jgi:hypothetical protein